MKVSWGLFYGKVFLTEILADENYSENQVRGIALAQHERNPTIGLRPGEPPFERAASLRFASVRRL